jgi:Domain of unknown function (DUF4384)/BON domain
VRKLVVIVELGVVVVGLGVAIWAIYRFWHLSSTPPCPPISAIEAQIRQDPAAQQCADISVEVDRCVVKLQGRIESEENRARLRSVVQNIRGITYVNDTLIRIVEAPFCEVLDILEPVQKHAETHNFGLKVRLVNKEGKKSPVYVQGENLIIEVTTPAKFESFVYVDYYSTDGQVQHLFPNIKEALNFLPPHSVYTVGQPDDKHVEWKPLPPFGRELISVIATKQPLVFTPKAPRYDPESARSYLDQLHQAIPRDLSQAEIAAIFYPIETRKTGAENP